MLVKKLIAGGLAVASLLSVGSTALAVERDDIIDVTYVEIEYDGYAVDSLNGVEAYYRPWGYNYQCSEYITRYFEEVYGISVSTTDEGPKVDGRDDLWFEETDEPKPGDVCFGPSWKRGKSYNHWAMVKSFDAEESAITLIEQNWRWNGQAGYERKIEFPATSYIVYTLCGLPPTEEELAAQAAAEEEALRQELIRSLESGFLIASSRVKAGSELPELDKLPDESMLTSEDAEVEVDEELEDDETLVANSMSAKAIIAEEPSVDERSIELFSTAISGVRGAMELKAYSVRLARGK